MKKLIIPSKLNEGDTVAFISISGGRAGDEDMIPRYLLGKRRFEKIFHVKVVETPHALRGSGYLYEHPEKRAEDLMWALSSEGIYGFFRYCYLDGCFCVCRRPRVLRSHRPDPDRTARET